MIKIVQKGDYSRTTETLKRLRRLTRGYGVLDKYGRRGVEALSAATPVDTGLTARSWYYRIEQGREKTSIIFCNSNVQNGVPIAIILQYGHATRNGGYVEGRDYINPALQPVFDEMAAELWKEVESA